MPGRMRVVLDNAHYHHAKLMRKWLTRPGCRIEPHFIPSYCPRLNPIERLRLTFCGLADQRATAGRAPPSALIGVLFPRLCIDDICAVIVSH
jgi:hypothetical protein